MLVTIARFYLTTKTLRNPRLATPSPAHFTLCSNPNTLPSQPQPPSPLAGTSGTYEVDDANTGDDSALLPDN